MTSEHPSLSSELRAELEAEFSADFASYEPDTLETYGRDWTRVHEPAPSVVVFPRSRDEVARFVRWCGTHGLPIVPSGGRTGLAAGAVATRGEAVLSLERMRAMDPVDTVARTVRVEAGAVTAAVHEHCAEHGLTWPVDFASAGSSQIGGNIATNAGGVRVVRYGLTRQWVLGLEVVTGEGECLDLNGSLEKNNTGLDLRQLFIGSEGTLGIVTAATLKLAPLPGESRVALLAVSDLPAALELFADTRRAGGFELNAFELVSRRCMELVAHHRGTPPPIAAEHPYFVLVELEPTQDNGPDAWLEHAFEAGLVQDGVLAESLERSRELWAYREGISESLTKTGFLHKNDVSLPISSLPGFVEALESTLSERYPDFDVYVFGHVGDGNLHINMMKPESWTREDFLERCYETDRILFDLVRSHEGSISAEHGIGLLKKPFLEYSRSPAELELFRRIKRSLDPLGLLNPGKILDGDSQT